MPKITTESVIIIQSYMPRQMYAKIKYKILTLQWCNILDTLHNLKNKTYKIKKNIAAVTGNRRYSQNFHPNPPQTNKTCLHEYS